MRTLALLAVIALLTILAVAASCAPRIPDPIRCPEDVPAAVAPPPDVSAVLALDARGVQIYQCRDSGWVNLAPDAELLTRAREIRHVVSHRAGPSWQSIEDGSTVFAAKAASAPSPNAIDQLLLKATVHAGPTGSLTPVAWIQRVATRGGLPIGPCAGGGEVSISEYSATYVFYAPGASGPRCGDAGKVLVDGAATGW